MTRSQGKIRNQADPLRDVLYYFTSEAGSVSLHMVLDSVHSCKALMIRKGSAAQLWSGEIGVKTRAVEVNFLTFYKFTIDLMFRLNDHSCCFSVRYCTSAFAFQAAPHQSFVLWYHDVNTVTQQDINTLSLLIRTELN